MRAQHFLLATAIGICGFGLTASAQNSSQSTGARIENALERAADRITGTTRPSNSLAPDAEDIRETLRDITNAAMTKGAFDDLVERFVDADRNRLGQGGFTEKSQPDLDARIAQLQADWKAKYNQDMKIVNKDGVFTLAFATIMQSEIADNARLAGERTVVTETGKTVARDESQKLAGGDTNLEKGRKIATVTVVPSHGLPEARLPMVHELLGWKIDVPDTYSAQQLHDNLLKHLTMFNQQKAQWPADQNEAYRMVSHHVLLAVMNTPDSDMPRTGMQNMPDRNMQNQSAPAVTPNPAVNSGVNTNIGANP